jgi:hypothetical protein
VKIREAEWLGADMFMEDLLFLLVFAVYIRCVDTQWGVQKNRYVGRYAAFFEQLIEDVEHLLCPADSECWHKDFAAALDSIVDMTRNRLKIPLGVLFVHRS